MNMNAIAMYLEVCKTRSVSKAAENLYVTQPAVSQAISQLESHLGVTLLNRNSRSISLTQEGETFYFQASDLYRKYLETQNLFTVTPSNPLRIGCSVTTATYILPQILESYSEDVLVRVENAHALKEKLLANDIDIAFIEGSITLDTFIEYPIHNFEAVFIASPYYLQNHHVSFENHRFLLREPGSSYRTFFDTIATHKGTRVEPYWESVSTESLIQAAVHHQGISLVPLDACKHLISSGDLVIYDVKIPTQYDKNALFVNKHRIHEPAIKDFINHVFTDGFSE